MKHAEKKIVLTKNMSFVAACRTLGVDENNIVVLFDMVKHSNSATLNHCNQVVDLIGYEKYIILKKWLYN